MTPELRQVAEVLVNDHVNKYVKHLEDDLHTAMVQLSNELKRALMAEIMLTIEKESIMTMDNLGHSLQYTIRVKGKNNV